MLRLTLMPMGTLNLLAQHLRSLIEFYRVQLFEEDMAIHV